MNFVTELTKRCTIIPTKTRETIFAVPRDNSYGTWRCDTPETEYKQIILRSHKLSVVTEVSSELLDEYATKLFKDTLTQSINEAILFGDGIGKPLGIVNSPGTITTERTGDMQQDLINMFVQFNGRGTWLVNSAFELMQMVPYSNSPELCGLPVTFTGTQPSIDKPGGIVLADLSKYIIADGGGRINTADLWKGSKSIRYIHKIDGHPSVLSHDGTSPFVVLGGFRVHDNVTGKIIVICMHCGEVWNNGTLKCWDGYRGCGGPLEEPGGHRVVCTYCGRIWPNRKVCWDGEDGCGGLF